MVNPYQAHKLINSSDRILILCDELETKLAQSQTDGAGLIEAVVGELVAG